MTASPFLPGHTYPMRGGGEFYVDAVGSLILGWRVHTGAVAPEIRLADGLVAPYCKLSGDLIAPAPEPLTGECFKNEWEDGDFLMFASKRNAKKHAELAKTANDKPIRTAVRCRFVEVVE